MTKEIVIFELIDEKSIPTLNFRPIREELPAGACPLAIANHHGFTVSRGQWFYPEDIVEFAEEKSGFKASGFEV